MSTEYEKRERDRKAAKSAEWQRAHVAKQKAEGRTALVKFWVHPDDREALKKYAERLQEKRERRPL